MRYLLTGMTATQVNHLRHDWDPNFVGLINETLVIGGHHVHWREPSVDWENEFFEPFDRVIVGVAPLTGLGANRAYGALNVIRRLWGSDKLSLLVDAPEPAKIGRSNLAVHRNPRDLVKDFFSYRKEYRQVVRDPEVQEWLLEAVSLLINEPWPTTIVPQLPWQNETQFRQQLPQVGPRMQLLNLDARLFESMCPDDIDLSRRHVWACENTHNMRWMRQSDLSWPVEKLPRTHRKNVRQETLDQLARSAGCLIPPTQAGTWWSPRYAMSLLVGTPVFTDWHESRFLSDSWTCLPSSYEVMSDYARAELVAEQYATYSKAIPRDLVLGA